MAVSSNHQRHQAATCEGPKWLGWTAGLLEEQDGKGMGRVIKYESLHPSSSAIQSSPVQYPVIGCELASWQMSKAKSWYTVHQLVHHLDLFQHLLPSTVAISPPTISGAYSDT